MNFLFRKTTNILLILSAALLALPQRAQGAGPVVSQAPPTALVDPRIGSGGHGHVFVGANVPFGMVQLGPTNISRGWDWCSGYHISDNTIIGFSHLHLNGTGCEDLGDISLMPVIGDVPLSRGSKDNVNAGLGSTFDRKTETVNPGYYAVHLDRFGINVELTATRRTGFHKYTFPPSEDPRIIIDLEHAIGDENETETHLMRESDTVVSGYRYSRAWANNQKIYFVIEFSHPMVRWQLSEGEQKKPGDSYTSPKTCGQASFDIQNGGEVLVKVGVSQVSVDNAKANLKEEQPGWDFNKTKKQADEAWNRELGKIAITTKNDKVKRIFYTSLYHTMMYPAVCSDVNGDYRGADDKVYRKSPFTHYTGFSLWDTYRAAHPLMTIIHPEKVDDMMLTMIDIHQKQGRLPIWHLMSCETECMVGNPAICVLADAVMKNFQGFSHGQAFEAMKQSALHKSRGLDLMEQYGYIPFDRTDEGLAKCMEYAIADWSLAQVADKLGKKEDYDHFIKRSQAYKHYFDPKTGFMRGRSSDGKFREEFNPFLSVHRKNDYTEGNAWQYTWLVPHDVKGLVGLFGSREKFLAKLDGLFTAEGDLGEQASPDISGLIGQYAHGNEPSHHVAYLYTCVGQPWKTADKVRQILTTLYSAQPDGLCGNEDMGQMSAWYILSTLGFYQVEPAGGKYVFGSPLIDEAVLDVGGGKTFRIVVKDNSPARKYIRQVLLNGKNYTRNYLDFKDISAGGTLEIRMTDQPSQLWYEEDKTPQK